MQGPCTVDAEWDGWSGHPTTALEQGGCSLPDWNAPGGTVWRPCRYARGTLHIRPDNDTGFDASIEMGLEDYILGISESPYAWGSSGGMAALEAQAVAPAPMPCTGPSSGATPPPGPGAGATSTTPPSTSSMPAGATPPRNGWIAVAATAGKVMTHPSETRDGALIPIETFYSSSTFGWTEDSENGFTAYVPYLRAVDDHWSRLPETGNPNARWPAPSAPPTWLPAWAWAP